MESTGVGGYPCQGPLAFGPWLRAEFGDYTRGHAGFLQDSALVPQSQSSVLMGSQMVRDTHSPPSSVGIEVCFAAGLSQSHRPPAKSAIPLGITPSVPVPVADFPSHVSLSITGMSPKPSPTHYPPAHVPFSSSPAGISQMLPPLISNNPIHPNIIPMSSKRRAVHFPSVLGVTKKPKHFNILPPPPPLLPSNPTIIAPDTSSVAQGLVFNSSLPGNSLSNGPSSSSLRAAGGLKPRRAKLKSLARNTCSGRDQKSVIHSLELCSSECAMVNNSKVPFSEVASRDLLPHSQ